MFLCGLCACFSVAVLGFVVNAALEIAINVTPLKADFGDGIAGGVRLGAVISALNWVLFFITIPAASLAIWLSIGRMPRRGITHKKPYLKWAVLWGMILVGATTTIFASFEGVQSGMGGFLVGVPIGGLAGLACGALFLGIVRPGTQLGTQTVDTF